VSVTAAGVGASPGQLSVRGLQLSDSQGGLVSETVPVNPSRGGATGAEEGRAEIPRSLQGRLTPRPAACRRSWSELLLRRRSPIGFGRPTQGRRCPPIAPDVPPWPEERQVISERKILALYRSFSRAPVDAALPATPGLKLTGVLSRLGWCVVGCGSRGSGWLLDCIRGGCVGASGGVRAWMALAAGLDRCCVAGRGGRVNLCTAKAFARLLEKPRFSLSHRQPLM